LVQLVLVILAFNYLHLVLLFLGKGSKMVLVNEGWYIEGWSIKAGICLSAQ
jgi:hypothetical protein